MHHTLRTISLCVSLATLTPSTAFAQTTPCPAFDTVFVVQVDSTVTAAQLQSNARRWFAVTFKDAKEVIQMDDNTTHTIIGKGSAKYPDGGWYNYTIEVNCKDGRFRASITNVCHVNPGSSYNAYAGVSVPNVALGTFYRCDQCTDYHRRHKEDHPKQTSKIAQGAKQCQSRILPQVTAKVQELAASLTNGMREKPAGGTNDGRDW
jgi:hypothetical protein